MPDRPTSNPNQFIQSAPVLQVVDVIETTDYYRNILGFNCDFVSSEYGVVWRDNAAIHFARSDENQKAARLFLWLIDVDRYYQEILQRGAHISIEIADRDYKIRDFGVEDINGAILIFGQDIY
ncbi:MAG TPA: hypothetical protein EYQ22_02685 [Gammaproteobacteria bacterium]|jgi:hypothetical protein|nr:hypothetical protein [Gammaproteobacteria bacterium]HIK69162.1 hypothetical protein [Pseudomonadales bacterium]